MDIYCVAKSGSSWIVVNKELDVFVEEGKYQYKERHNNQKLFLSTTWEPIAYEELVQWE